MSYYAELKLAQTQASTDIGGALRIADARLLQDLKIVNRDSAYLWTGAGTGTGAWSGNGFNMSITGGQYYVRSSKQFQPYVAGKQQTFELTMDDFGLQTDVEKTVGCLSSAVAPYNTTYDGIRIVNDGSTYHLKIDRAGTSIVSVPFSQWTGYEALSNYDFDKFTVLKIDYLWLGGADVNVWFKTPSGFILAHSYDHVGTGDDVMFLSPHQTARYQISGSGTGSFRQICGMAESGSHSEVSGVPVVARTSRAAGITCASAGTTYLVQAVRQTAADRNIPAKLHTAFPILSTNNDILEYTVHINPTFAGASPTFTPISGTSLESAPGNGTITVSAAGKIIMVGEAKSGTTVSTDALGSNALSYLGSTLDNTMDVMALCVTPISGSVTVFGTMVMFEY